MLFDKRILPRRPHKRKKFSLQIIGFQQVPFEHLRGVQVESSFPYQHIYRARDE